MKKSWRNAPFDLTIVPQDEKVEHKYSEPRPVPHANLDLEKMIEGGGVTFPAAPENSRTILREFGSSVSATLPVGQHGGLERS